MNKNLERKFPINNELEEKALTLNKFSKLRVLDMRAK